MPQSCGLLQNHSHPLRLTTTHDGPRAEQSDASHAPGADRSLHWAAVCRGRDAGGVLALAAGAETAQLARDYARDWSGAPLAHRRGHWFDRAELPLAQRLRRLGAALSETPLATVA